MSERYSQYSQEEILVQIQSMMVRHFNMEELQQLCFVLGDVEFENLSGETRQGKTRELIQFLDRHGSIHKLHAALCQFRPRIAWPKIHNETEPKPQKTKTKRAELTLEGDFDSLDNERLEDLVAVLAVLLKVDKEEIRILNVLRGSIVVELEMPEDATERLRKIATVEESKLIEKGILSVKIGETIYRFQSAKVLSIAFPGINYEDYLTDTPPNEKPQWSEWFHRNGQIVYRYLYAILGNKNDAEACLQQTFVRFFMDLMEEYAPTRPLLHLLIRIARNEAYNFLRGQKSERKVGKKSVHQQINFEEIVLQDIAIERAIEWVITEAELNEDQSTLFVYGVVGDLKPAEIANIMGISPNNARQRLWRLRKKIQRFINHEDISGIFDDPES